jgi:hypothetical protein
MLSIYKPVKLWRYEHYQYDDASFARNYQFFLVDSDTGDPGLEIIYARDLVYSGIPLVEVGWLKGEDNGGTTGVGGQYYIPLVQDIKIALGDVDANNKVDIITTMTYAPNPLYTIFTIFNWDMASFVMTPIVINGMPPIDQIAVGDFDLGYPYDGDEFVFFFELAKMNLPSFIYDLIGAPTMFMKFAWMSYGGLWFSPNNLIGISPTGEPSVNHWVETSASGDPVIIVESKGGDLFSLDMTSNSGNVVMQTEVFESIAVPYAHGAFVTGDFYNCPGGFITTVAANSIACYDKLSFKDATEVWSLTLDFGVIQHIVVGDLDGDSIDDLLLASVSGYVWVVRSEFLGALALELNGNSATGLDRVLNGITSNYGMVVGMGIIAFGMIAALPATRRKFKIKL